MFSPSEQARLQAACSVNKHTGKDNPDLDQVIRDLMKTVPHRFHSVDSLSTRRFFDEPKTNVPMASYVNAYKK